MHSSDTAASPINSSTQEVKKNIPSPLSTQSKKLLIQELKKIDVTRLKSVLANAALELHTFPSPIRERLDTLQLAYQQNSANTAVKPHLRQAIIEFINTEACAQFQTIIKKPFQENIWNSAFLNYLRTNLQIKLMEEPMVEAAIQDGKIYWRIIQNEKVLYDRQLFKRKPFNFMHAATWRMDWDSFCKFKSSGKRSSSVAITQELFAQKFGMKYQDEAKRVWNDLKGVGILNHRNRFSSAWHAVSNSYITLASLHSLTYPKILTALYSIANSETNREVISQIPSASIFRRERSLKVWAKTGLVKNVNPRSADCCTQRFDVSTYSDLVSHRNTEEEKQKFGGKLNYDHNPSADIVKQKIQTIITDIDSQLISQKSELKDLEDTLEAKKQRQNALNNLGRLTTRGAAKIIVVTPEIKGMEAGCKLLRESICKLIAKKTKLTTEMQGHGDLWWSIAIPEKLHRQGDTFLQCTKDQKLSAAHPFIRDVTSYLDMVEARPADFSLKPDDYIKILGAFRFLYRSLYKKPETVAGIVTIGSTPQTFFQDKAVRKQIDTLILERMRRYMQKREGVQAEEKDVVGVRAALQFN